MEILLTGGTGFIGHAVLQRLLASGHEVTAVVRSDDAAQRLQQPGVVTVKGDLFDTDWLTGQLRTVHGAIHTAAGSDADDPALNDAVLAAVRTAFAGTDHPFVHTGGIWTYGDNPDVSEDDPAHPPAITAWRVEGEARLLASGLRASVVQPGIVYGHGQGIPGVLVGGPRDGDGALVLIGSGDQHWVTVHVDDLADLYVRVLEQAPGGEAYAAASGVNPTVRELGEAVGNVVPGSSAEAAERLGEALAEALLLDQRASGAKARALGWEPVAPPLVDLLADGYPEDR